MPYFIVLLLLLALADGERDNHPEKVRPIPAPGIPVPPPLRAELEKGVARLSAEIESLRGDLKDKPELLDLLPDVQIYGKAVNVALAHDEFHDPKEFELAREQLEEGFTRARLLRTGSPEWTATPGPHPRGYVSKIDGSIQPYGLYLPSDYPSDRARKRRLDTWFHGRMEHLGELNFIDWAGTHFDDSVRIAGGPFTPAGALVVQLYGRFCNASKFAGEADFFEVLDEVKRHTAVDADRIVIRGFSMGGAASWHLAVHHAGLWAAAAPGAGFSETPEFLRVFQKETLQPTDFERKLWHWYNATDYAVNLFNCPTVAYSGADDPQKQAADAMARALREEGLELTHLVGPATGHRYHPDSRRELDRLIDQAVERGRDPMPQRIRFTTWTLKYNQLKWLTVDALERHWERARVEAERQGDRVTLTTANVAALSLAVPAATNVTIDGAELAPAPHFVKTSGSWAPGAPQGLVKRHGLQGPIDDAFLDPFVFVTPTGKPLSEKTGAWMAGELAHAMTEWRRQFRGDVRVVTDQALSDADLERYHLVLWGDPASNAVLRRIADRLPLRWDGKELRMGARSFASEGHMPLLIYPNPLNPKRYVVLNSGFTYREYDYLNNARQVPRLPDWAVADVTISPNTRWPGKVVAADFFGERWEFR